MMLARLLSRYPVRPGYWFAPKAYGYGAVPANWKGLMAVSAFVLLAGLIANTAQHRSPAWLALWVPLVLGFIWLCWAKTDGDWRWRWGKD
jgi:hypothetical protein